MENERGILDRYRHTNMHGQSKEFRDGYKEGTALNRDPSKNASDTRSMSREERKEFERGRCQAFYERFT